VKEREKRERERERERERGKSSKFRNKDFHSPCNIGIWIKKAKKISSQSKHNLIKCLIEKLSNLNRRLRIEVKNPFNPKV